MSAINIVMSDNSAKKIGLSSVGEIKKGALITLPCYPGGTQNYRILDVNGTQIKVLAMDWNNQTSRFSSSNNIYKNSTLDNLMENTIYPQLKAVLGKDAIVRQTIKQSVYTCQLNSRITSDATIQYYNDFNATPADSAKRGLKRTSEVSVGTRHVYALDIDDIIAYFSGGFNCQQLNELFFNTKSSTSKHVWLRSASGFASGGYCPFARSVYGYYGGVFSSDALYDYDVRPAFVIDLAKL